MDTVILWWLVQIEQIWEILMDLECCQLQQTKIKQLILEDHSIRMIPVIDNFLKDIALLWILLVQLITDYHHWMEQLTFHFQTKGILQNGLWGRDQKEDGSQILRLTIKEEVAHQLPHTRLTLRKNSTTNNFQFQKILGLFINQLLSQKSKLLYLANIVHLI